MYVGIYLPFRNRLFSQCFSKNIRVKIYNLTSPLEQEWTDYSVLKDVDNHIEKLIKNVYNLNYIKLPRQT